MDSTYWVYQYDALGQVTSGKKYSSDGRPVPGQQFEYAFDDIGNRTRTSAGGNEWGTELRQANYTVNSQNQITSRTVPGFIDVWGVATNNATVTVNDQPTQRSNTYWRGELAFNNTVSAQYPSITNLAVQKNGSNPDKVTNVIGRIYLPKTPEAFTYDLDGNMTSDGRWNFTWNAENRLIKAESLSDAPSASKRKVEHAYDYAGRLLRRTEYNGSTGTYVETDDLKYLYDGTHCVAEIEADNTTLVRSYVWGTDLSGTLNGAGGVGGLLAITFHDTATTHYPFYDGKGNIMGLVRADTGTLTAEYEYDPFGRTIRANGSRANGNLFRFSTKRVDPVTDHVHYEYRVYNAITGTWLSKDPLEELGHQVIKGTGRSEGETGEENELTPENIYNICFNDSVNYYDVNGEWVGPALRLGRVIAVEIGKRIAMRKAKQLALNIAKCESVHAAYDAAQSIADQKPCKACVKCPEYKAHLLARASEILGRGTYLKLKCDYVLPGSVNSPQRSAGKEKGHKDQLAQKIIAFGKCAAKAKAAGCVDLPTLQHTVP